MELPKTKENKIKNDIVCKCRPICKSRRRVWKGEVQNTSVELLLERKPLQECFRRWPTKVYANSPCPLFAKTRRVILKSQEPPSVVRICQAPIDDSVDTPYLKYAELAKRLGAWQAVKSRCAFCSCCKCCGCGSRDYVLSEHRDNDRRRDMRVFDKRVKNNYQEMRIINSESEISRGGVSSQVQVDRTGALHRVLHEPFEATFDSLITL